MVGERQPGGQGTDQGLPVTPDKRPPFARTEGRVGVLAPPPRRPIPFPGAETPERKEAGRVKRGKDGTGAGGIGGKTRIALASLAMLGAAEATGAIVAEQTNNQPMNSATIKADLAWPWDLGQSAIKDIWGMLNREVPVVIPPDVFDYSVPAGQITSENTVALSQEEIKTLPPITIDTAKNTSTILFPFQLPEGAKAQFTKTTIVPKDNGQLFSTQAEKVDISTILLPIGTKIINPIEGAHVFLQRGNPELGEDPNLVIRAVFFWYDEANDQLYLFSITPEILPGPLFKPLIQDGKYFNWNYDWETLPIPDRGLELMETTQDSQPVAIQLTIFKGKTNNLDAKQKNLSEQTLRYGGVDFFVRNNSLITKQQN